MTGKQQDKYKFKVPTLRNVALTFPYMHNGSLIDLEQVIDHYNNLYNKDLKTSSYNELNSIYKENYIEEIILTNEQARTRKYLSKKIKKITLSQEEKIQLLEFLSESLTDLDWTGEFTSR